jgi:hypothetical protein
MGNALIVYWIAAEHCYKSIGNPLGNAERFLDSLCQFLKGIGKPLENAQ